jgi:hypothetical protein
MKNSYPGSGIRDKHPGYATLPTSCLRYSVDGAVPRRKRIIDPLKNWFYDIYF